MYRDDENADGEVPEGVEVDPNQELQGGEEKERKEGPEIVIKTREPIPREFQIRREDVDQYGRTRGCAGCRSFS